MHMGRVCEVSSSAGQLGCNTPFKGWLSCRSMQAACFLADLDLDKRQEKTVLTGVDFEIACPWLSQNLHFHDFVIYTS